MIRVNLLSVGIVEETGGILLILRASKLERLLVIETGPLEGQAVAIEAEGIRSERPLTQDLLYNAIERLGARVKEVTIPEFHDETFFATVVLSKPDGGTSVELDARPSDAIALALRARAPIYVSDEVLTRLGIPEDRTGRFADLFEEEDVPPEGRIIH